MSTSNRRHRRVCAVAPAVLLHLASLVSTSRFAAGQTSIQPAGPGGAATGRPAPRVVIGRGVPGSTPGGQSRPTEIRFGGRNVGKPKIEPADPPAGFRYEAAFTPESFRIESVVDGFLPEYFRGATVVGAASELGWKDDHGRCTLVVDADRRIYVAVRWDENTIPSDEVKREILTMRRLIAGGWVPLTRLEWIGTRGHVDRRLVFVRECKSGDRLTLRTSVGYMPQVIVPVDDAEVPQLADLEPDPQLPEIVQRNVVGGKMAVLLANRRYAEIESWLQGYLKSGAQFASGAYKFTASRSLIGYTSSESPTREQFDEYVRNIRGWQAAYPSSRAAKLTLAAIRTERAEFYEEEPTGGDRGATIDDDRRRSLEALFELEQGGDTTPDLYRVMMLMADDASWDVELVDHYVERMLDSGTWCPGGLSAAFYYYEKHLHGPERLDKGKLFFRRILERSGERYGKALFAATLHDVTFRPNDMAFVDYGIDWRVLKAGFEELEKRHPNSSLNRQAFCRWACIAGDRVTATRLFGELKQASFEPSERIWKNEEDLRTRLTWAAEDFDLGDQSRYFDHSVREPVFAARNAAGDIYFCDRDTTVWKIAADGSRVRLGRPTSHIPTRIAGAHAVSDLKNVAVFGLCHGQCLVIDLLRGTTRVLDTEVFSTIDAVAVTPDGKTVVAADRGGRIFVFDLTAADPSASRRVLLEGLGEKVVHLAFLEQGHKLLGFDDDGMVRIWSFPEGREFKSWDADTGTFKHLAAVSRDGRQLATTHTGRAIQIWSLPEGGKVREIPFFNSVQSALAFDPSGRHLVVARDPLLTGGNAPLETFSLAGGLGSRQFYGHRGVVHSIDFDAAGTMLTAGADMSLRIWEPATLFPGRPAPSTAASGSPGGSSGGLGGLPRKRPEIPAPIGIPVTQATTTIAVSAAAIAWSPDGRLYFVDDSGALRRTGPTADAKSVEQVTVVPSSSASAPPGTVRRITEYALRISPDGKLALVASHDVVALIRLDDLTVRPTVIANDPSVLPPVAGVTRSFRTGPRDVRFIPGQNRALVAPKQGFVRLYEWNEERSLRVVRELGGGGRPLLAIGITTDGRTLRTVDGRRDLGGSVDSYNLETGEKTGTWSVDADFLSKAEFDTGADRVSFATYLQKMVLQNAADGVAVSKTPSPNDFMSCMTFSPDGRTLALGTGSTNFARPASIQIYSAADGKLLKYLPGHQAAVTSLAFSSDGRRLASGSRDGSIRIWDVEK